MIITTELSGRGHYGVCSVLPRSSVPDLMERMGKFRSEIKEKYGSWTKTNFDVDPWGRTGLEGSLFCLDTTGENEEIRLGYVPSKFDLAFTSLELLNLCNDLEKQRDSRKERMPSEAILEVYVGRCSHGWGVKANFGDPVWDVIESDHFATELLPVVKLRLQQLWEDWTGNDFRHSMSNTFVRDGVSSRGIQIYHPMGNGLWIEGSRNTYNSYQLIDHNTDTPRDAFAHIYALCVVLDLCRKHIESSKTS